MIRSRLYIKMYLTVLCGLLLVVLSLGIGWQPLRRLVVGKMPEGLRDLVPAIRG